MKIIISADSTCDLSPEIIKNKNIPIMPLAVYLGEEEIIDDGNAPEKIYSFFKKTKTTPRTAARSIGDYKSFFERNRPADGFLIHFCISKELSASYDNANNASKEVPNVFVIDSRSLSTGIGVQVLYAIKLVEKGLSAEAIVAKINERVDRTQCSFIVKDLTYLHKGGRCSATKLFFAKTLALRPQIICKDGRLIAGKKYMLNFNACIKKYVNDILKDFNTPDLDICFITHTKMEEPKIIEEIKSIIKSKYNFKEIVETIAGGTVTSHCGMNTIGILYYN
jgi:DegV family protein with EDD domain